MEGKALKTKRIIIGTAGHIDHGKTTLVKALTGVDCDRLPQEKQRGITIELGFAPLKLPSGKVASIVDVPGHEKFIRQMVAGASGIDFVMLVVAADEGVMPQTREHLEILEVLGVKKGIVVLTKIDLVDEEWLSLVEEDLKETLAGTFLDGARICKVSAVTGQGIDELLKVLDRELAYLEDIDVSGPFVLWVDRVFVKQGFGVVVTGSSYSGKVKKGQILDLLPVGLKTRVRNINVHKQVVNEAYAGQRVALNLADVSYDDVQRGYCLAEANFLYPTYVLGVKLKVFGSYEKRLYHWQRIRFYIGTAEVLGRLNLLDRDFVAPNQEVFAQIILEEPVVADRKQHFVIRQYSPLVTIGGGYVLFAYGKRAKTKLQKEKWVSLLKDLDNASDIKRILLLLEYYKEIELEELIKKAWAWKFLVDKQVVIDAVIKSGGAFLSKGNRCFSANYYSDLKQRLLSFLEKYHKDFPHRVGVESDELWSKVFSDYSKQYYNELLQLFIDEGLIKKVGNYVMLSTHEVLLDEKQKAMIADIEDKVKERAFMPPSIAEIDKVALDVLINKGKVVIVGGFVFHKDIIDKGVLLLKEIFKRRGEITPANFREATSSTRKYIIPLLEYYDSLGITKRVGNKRVLLISKDKDF